MKTIQFKNEQDMEYTSHQRRYREGKQIPEKKLNIIHL